MVPELDNSATLFEWRNKVASIAPYSVAGDKK